MTGPRRKSLRLAVFCAFHHQGGIERILPQLTRELSKRGFAITLVAHVEKRMLPFVRSLSWIRRWIPWDHGASSEHILKELRQGPPDIILNTDHFHQPVEVALGLGRPLFWRLGSHPLWWENGFSKADGACAAAIIKKIGLFADRVITVSDFIRSAFTAHGFKNTETIHEGCDTGFFRPHFMEGSAFRREFRLAEDEIAVGVVANFTWQKRHALVLDALQHLGKRTPSFKCFFVGGSFGSSMRENEAGIRRATKKLGLGAKVVFTGFRPDIRCVLNGLDIVVFPFLHEGFGLSLIEAMACGKPVLANDSGSFPEIVKDGEDGILVPREAPLSLAQKLQDLLEQPEERKRLGARARTKVLQEFSLSGQVEKYIRSFQNYAEPLMRVDELRLA